MTTTPEKTPATDPKNRKTKPAGPAKTKPAGPDKKKAPAKKKPTAKATKKTPDESYIIDIADLVADDKNVNLGSERGQQLLEESLDTLKFGRPISVDKDKRVMAGNKTLQAAIALGYTKVRVIPSEGDTFIAHQRTDVTLDSAQGRALAIADNIVSRDNFTIDYEMVKELDAEHIDLDMSVWFEHNELDLISGGTTTKKKNPADQNGEIGLDDLGEEDLELVLTYNVTDFGTVQAGLELYGETPEQAVMFLLENYQA